MTYDEAIAYIHAMPKFSKVLGNESLKHILRELGNPQHKLRFVHVAGTNGKGSVCAMIDSIMRSCEIRVGLFTSPYLEVFNERIRVDGEMISDGEIARLTSAVKQCMDKTQVYLSEFALVFVIAVLYFLQEGCEAVILETGLGGQLDATNAIEESMVSVITSVGLDHMQYLGNTKAEIAAQKCGIIKKGGRVIMCPLQDDEVSDTVRSFCEKQSARLYIPQMPNVLSDGLVVYGGREYTLSLKGHYQAQNAVCAIKAAELLSEVGFPITYTHIAEGLKCTSWPGRFEWLSDRLLLDGCHNPDGARELSLSLENEKRPITLVVSIMRDKAYEKIAEQLSKISERVIVTQVLEQRAAGMDELAAGFFKCGVCVRCIDSPINAVKAALSDGGICVVCGSLYLIGEVRSKKALIFG